MRVAFLGQPPEDGVEISKMGVESDPASLPTRPPEGARNGPQPRYTQ